jgi:ferredoxin
MSDHLTKPTASPGTNPAAAIDYELFLDCVHCGLCTASCPTYTELGDENDGPRGRIYLMRLVADGKLPVGDKLQRHLQLCLDCRRLRCRIWTEFQPAVIKRKGRSSDDLAQRFPPGRKVEIARGNGRLCCGV